VVGGFTYCNAISSRESSAFSVGRVEGTKESVFEIATAARFVGVAQPAAARSSIIPRMTILRLI